jgi:hypothetical protein
MELSRKLRGFAKPGQKRHRDHLKTENYGLNHVLDPKKRCEKTDFAKLPKILLSAV